MKARVGLKSLHGGGTPENLIKMRWQCSHTYEYNICVNIIVYILMNTHTTVYIKDMRWYISWLCEHQLIRRAGNNREWASCMCILIINRVRISNPCDGGWDDMPSAGFCVRCVCVKSSKGWSYYYNDTNATLKVVSSGYTHQNQGFHGESDAGCGKLITLWLDGLKNRWSK